MSQFVNISEKTRVSGLSESGLLSDATTEIFHTVNFAVLAAIVASFGIVANIINIIIFLKQGFGDTVNVSLFALALTDLSALITLQWINLLRNPLFFNSGVPLIPTEVFHLTAGWPHGFCARMTSWITAYVTLERCLCVLIPLKIKRIVTPRLAVTVLVSIFVGMVLTLIPDYSTAYIGWRFVPERNQSMLGLLFTEGRESMAILSFTLAAYTQMISFLAVIIFTTILVIKMKQKSKWRASTATRGQGSTKGSDRRSQKTVNMVILIAVIYSVCFIPMMLTYLMTSVEPEFSIVGQYQNIFLVAWSFAFLVDSVNSSVNIFVYYTMSTKYRDTFDALIRNRLCGPQAKGK